MKFKKRELPYFKLLKLYPDASSKSEYASSVSSCPNRYTSRNSIYTNICEFIHLIINK